MDYIANLNFKQVWLAPVIGLVLTIVIIARQRIYDAIVEVFRLGASFVVNWVIEPIRKYLWIVFEKFEYYIMRKLLFDPLVKIGLFKVEQYPFFCYLFYTMTTLAALWLLWTKLPPILPILWANGRVRRSWVLLSLSLMTTLCICASGTLWMRGYAMESYVLSAVACALVAFLVSAYFKYPNTNDWEDVVAAWPSLNPENYDKLLDPGLAPSCKDKDSKKSVRSYVRRPDRG